MEKKNTRKRLTGKLGDGGSSGHTPATDLKRHALKIKKKKKPENLVLHEFNISK